jgi:hypothetical protein
LGTARAGAGGNGLNILEGHSKATMFLIFNNAAQGILSSFFFKYAGKSCSFRPLILSSLFLMGISNYYTMNQKLPF